MTVGKTGFCGIKKLYSSPYMGCLSHVLLLWILTQKEFLSLYFSRKIRKKKIVNWCEILNVPFLV